jgi:hypothetical protein
VRNVEPRTVNRLVCYCDDCQAFLHHLDRADLLDAQGGSDVIQVAPNMLSFHRGADRIAAVRLTSKGMYRWFASCCKTPLGNTVGAGVPFVGIQRASFQGDADEALGPSRGSILGKFAIGENPESPKLQLVRMIAHTGWLLAGWKIRGQAWPHPFFEKDTRAPRYPVTTLIAAERDGLRACCGPRPTA